jgi:hypothetical protein
VSERVLVPSSTFPQHAGDPRGRFIVFVLERLP